MTIDELEKLEDLLAEFTANVSGNYRERCQHVLGLVRRQIKSEKA